MTPGSRILKLASFGGGGTTPRESRPKSLEQARTLAWVDSGASKRSLTYLSQFSRSSATEDSHY